MLRVSTLIFNVGVSVLLFWSEESFVPVLPLSPVAPLSPLGPAFPFEPEASAASPTSGSAPNSHHGLNAHVAAERAFPPNTCVRNWLSASSSCGLSLRLPLAGT